MFTATYRHLSNLLNRRNPVALPQLTDEQRKEALAKAAERVRHVQSSKSSSSAVTFP